MALPTEQAHALVTPLAVAIFPPVQFPPVDFSIAGARVSAFMGRHRNVYGIDLGVIGNRTEQDFVGIGVSGIFNHTTGLTTVLGLQAAGVTNINTQKTRVVGVQVSLFNYNSAESSVVGFQIGPVANLSRHTSVYGMQVGLYNAARTISGFQIGLINSTDNLHGIQIGLVNFNRSGPFAVAPILNVGF